MVQVRENAPWTVAVVRHRNVVTQANLPDVVDDELLRRQRSGKRQVGFEGCCRPEPPRAPGPTCFIEVTDAAYGIDLVLSHGVQVLRSGDLCRSELRLGRGESTRLEPS